MREEQRTITALFVDLAGSTALGERLAGEEVKLVVGEAIARVVDEVERFGGYVKDLAGDGVLAFFGAPVSNEDDPERAARAALSILGAIADYGSEVASAWGVDALAARVGICTGPVALGQVGSGRRVEYAAYGDTVNTAARLQAAASPGAALVDARTQRLVEPLFAWGEPVDLQLKGKSAQVRAYSLEGALPAASRLRSWAEPAIMVGRAREVSTMRDALARVRAGAGGVVLVIGEAGLGKTRLLADTRVAAATGGHEPELLWLEGRCASYGETVPYFAFRELLREWLRLDEGDPALRVRITLRRVVGALFEGREEEDVYPYLASLLGVREGDALLAAPELAAEELQQRTFGAFGGLLDRLARTRPVVVAIEDLHWADPTSVQLVRSLFQVAERTALLLVLTQRDERDHLSWGLREAAVRDFPHLIRELALEPLPADDERDLLHALIGTGTLTEELERRLLDAADGNPLYLEELAHSLVEAETVSLQGERGWPLGREGSIAVPETIEKVILARADRLSPPCRAALTAASVVGRQFDPLLLHTLVGDESLDEILHELQRLGFIVASRRWPEPEYRFKHVLIQEAVYRTILSAERARLHRLAAESLERRDRETPEHVLGLARHWAAAGVPDRAIVYFKRGAELALHVYANGEAVEALAAALDLIGATPDGAARDEHELELRTVIGVPLVALRGYGALEVGEHYSRARDLCLRLGRPVSAPILRGLAIHAVNRLELGDAREHSVALLAAARRDADPVMLVEAEYALGVTSFWLGELAASRRHLEAAVAGYSPEHHESHVALYSQDPKVICLSRLAWSLALLGYPEQAVSTLDAALALAEDHGHPYSSCYANVFGAFASLELQDEPRVDQLAAAVEALAGDERYRLWQLAGTVLRAWPAAREGDLGAISAMQASLRQLDEIGHPLFDTLVLLLVARGYRRAGQSSAGLEAVNRALELSVRSGQRYLNSHLRLVRAQLLRADGAAGAEVEEALLEAIGTARAQGARLPELRAALELARWRTEAGTGESQQEALRLLGEVYGSISERGASDMQAARSFLVAQGAELID